jgi:hypothetical protein
MIDERMVRKLALSFPEAEERAHHGHPDFRVREKIFATLWPGEKRAVVKLTREDQADLIKTDPKAFSLTAWTQQGWTSVHLEHVSAAQFRCLLDTAWRLVAPKKLVAKHDAASL